MSRSDSGERWSVRLSALAGFAIGAVLALPSATQRVGAEASVWTVTTRAALTGAALAAVLVIVTASLNRWRRRR